MSGVAVAEGRLQVHSEQYFSSVTPVLRKNIMENTPVIHIESLTKVYKTGSTEVRALNGIDLCVDEGEMIAIMGASGSGKSTLMNILGGLDYPTSGTYTLDGVRVDTMSRNQLADIRNQKIGFVFQGFNLLARTSALDNVVLPMLYDRAQRHKDPRQQAVDALTRVGLGERMDHEPTELSGGQQQRVAIARAIVTQPSILLADEPTGNLDSSTTTEILALFQELNSQGITVIIVTHEPDVSEHVKRVVELRDGVIIRDEYNENQKLAKTQSRTEEVTA